MFLFFFAKNAFFFCVFWSKSPHKIVRLKIAFLDRSQSTNVLVVVVRASSTNKPLFLDSKENDFSETKGNDDPKKAPTCTNLRFCGFGFGRRRASCLFSLCFKNLRAFFSERERDRSRKRSDRAKNDAAR